jgi:hypothetical protein
LRDLLRVRAHAFDRDAVIGGGDDDCCRQPAGRRSSPDSGDPLREGFDPPQASAGLCLRVELRACGK